MGFSYARLNDFDELEARLTPKTVAVILELIQGEGGVNVADETYIKNLRKLCDERNMLLIVDEVQTGMGRTGKMFAFQHYGIQPDLMTLAKSLGSGVPIGALVVNDKVAGDIFTPGSHASTYGGNPLVCAAALAVFKAIRKEKLLQNTEAMGRYLRDKLNGLKQKYSFIKEVRGKSLMLGVELDRPGASVVDKARELGLLINCTQDKVLRIMPALTVTKRMIDRAVAILDRVFSEAKP